MKGLITQAQADEFRRLVESGEARARQILTDHMDDLRALARALLEYETLSAEEVRRVIRGDPITRAEEPPVRPSKPRSSVPTSGSAPAGSRPGGLEPEPQPGA